METIGIFKILESWGLYGYCKHRRWKLHPITRPGTAMRTVEGEHQVRMTREWACPLCRVWPNRARVTDAEVALYLGTNPNRWMWWEWAHWLAR